MNKSTAKSSVKSKNWDSPGRLTREVQGRIGEQLRKMHDEIVQQGVPDRFRDLLKKLENDEPD